MAKNQLPDGCSSPMVFKFSSSTMPICQYAITADESYPALDKILNDEVIPQLNQINGIGNLSVAGAPDRYVYVDIDQQKLDAFGISLEQVGQAKIFILVRVPIIKIWRPTVFCLNSEPIHCQRPVWKHRLHPWQK